MYLLHINNCFFFNFFNINLILRKRENSKGLSFNRVDHSPVHNSLLTDTTLVHSNSGNNNSRINYDNRRKRFQEDDYRKHRYY